MIRSNILKLSVLSLVMSGCAKTPPVEVAYFLPKGDIKTTVTRTFSCDKEMHAYNRNSAEIHAVHRADSTQKHSFDFGALNGPLSNTQASLQFYDDGRLKSVNSTSVGQGEAILKTALSIAATFMWLGGERKVSEDFCKTLMLFSKDKPYTLTYSGTLGDAEKRPKNAKEREESGLPKLDRIPNETTNLMPSEIIWETVLSPEPDSIAANEMLEEFIGLTKAIATFEARPSPVTMDDFTGYYTLEAQQPGTATLTVTTGMVDYPNTPLLVLKDELIVSLMPNSYSIPIPRAAAFGKQVFVAEFNDSGSLGKLSYDKDTGVGQVLNIASSGYDAFHTTPKEDAEAKKAMADAIVQDQRLTACLANPVECK